jgi:hypothetical protein
MATIEPKRIIGFNNELFVIRIYYVDGMQEKLDPSGTAKDKWIAGIERERIYKENIDRLYKNKLAPDSEEQLRYNAVINSILDYKDYNEYKYKTSLKYKVLRFFKLSK